MQKLEMEKIENNPLKTTFLIFKSHLILDTNL